MLYNAATNCTPGVKWHLGWTTADLAFLHIQMDQDASSALAVSKFNAVGCTFTTINVLQFGMLI